MLAVGVLILVIVDLLVLVIFTGIVLGQNINLIQRTVHKENPVTVKGVSS